MKFLTMLAGKPLEIEIVEGEGEGAIKLTSTAFKIELYKDADEPWRLEMIGNARQQWRDAQEGWPWEDVVFQLQSEKQYEKGT